MAHTKEYRKKYYQEHKGLWESKYGAQGRSRKEKLKKKTEMQRLNSEQAKFKRALEHGLPIEEAITRAYPQLLSDTQINAKLKQLQDNRYLAEAIQISQQKYLQRLNEALLDLKIDKKDILAFIADRETLMLNKVKSTSGPATDRVAASVLDGVKKDIGLRVERSESKRLNVNWDMTEEEKLLMKDILKEGK